MITIFSCPRPFHGHLNIIQRNAIKSWALLRPKPEVILLGNDRGVAEICAEVGLIHIEKIDRNECGTPLVNSIFQVAQERATYPIVCYINSDIILMSEFMPAVQTVASGMSKFLILGQRWDLDLREEWDFDSPAWELALKAVLSQKGKIHPPTGIDFFCFPRGAYTDIPPFAIGRFAWDNWLVWYAWSKGIPLVDITNAAVIIHQNHDYAATTIISPKLQEARSEKRSPASAGKEKIKIGGHWVAVGPEVTRNIALVPDDKNLNIWAATWMVNRKGRLVRRRLKLTPSYLYYQIKCVLPLYWPTFGRLVRWMLAVKSAILKAWF